MVSLPSFHPQKSATDLEQGPNNKLPPITLHSEIKVLKAAHIRRNKVNIPHHIFLEGNPEDP